MINCPIMSNNSKNILTKLLSVLYKILKMTKRELIRVVGLYLFHLEFKTKLGLFVTQNMTI